MENTVSTRSSDKLALPITRRLTEYKACLLYTSIAAVGLWFYNNGACPLQAMSPSSDTASSGSYQQITASQVKERLDKGDKITVIDVRTPDEYAAGHIPGSLLIPFDEIKVKSDQLPQDKNTEIVVYCRSGRRSAIAA